MLSLHSEAVLTSPTPLSQFGIKLMVQPCHDGPVEALLNGLAARVTHALTQGRVFGEAGDGYCCGFRIDGNMLGHRTDIVLIREQTMVVLQGQSREAINPKKQDGFVAAARALDKTIRDSGSKTVFFMTWGYKAKPEMSAALEDAYTKIGNELDAYVVPVGVAFRLGLAENPDMELYFKDGKHPSHLGSYLTAAVFYAALTGRSPEGSEFTDGLPTDQATFARRIAWKAVRQYYGW